MLGICRGKWKENEIVLEIAAAPNMFQWIVLENMKKLYSGTNYNKWKGEQYEKI